MTNDRYVMHIGHLILINKDYQTRNKSIFMIIAEDSFISERELKISLFYIVDHLLNPLQKKKKNIHTYKTIVSTKKKRSI